MAQQSFVGIDEVSLVSIFVESVLYGLFIVLFIASTAILVGRFKGSKSPINKPMLTASIAMFIFATVHVGTDLRRILIAFLHTANKGGPVPYLSKVDDPIYILKNSTYVVQTLVGDTFILYRLYLVWQGDKRVVLPIAIPFIASIGAGIGSLQGFARTPADEPVFIVPLQKWIVSFFSLTLFTNLSATTLIAYRIWSMHQATKGLIRASERTILPAMVVIIESGSIYSACLVILLSLYETGRASHYIVLDALSQIIGVVFSLVIVRVGLGISSDKIATRSRTTTLGPLEARARPTDDSENTIDLANINAFKIDMSKSEISA